MRPTRIILSAACLLQLCACTALPDVDLGGKPAAAAEKASTEPPPATTPVAMLDGGAQDASAPPTDAGDASLANADAAADAVASDPITDLLDDHECLDPLFMACGDDGKNYNCRSEAEAAGVTVVCDRACIFC